MPATTANDVAALLGRTGEAAFVAVATQAVTVARALCSSYTRGEGFDAATGEGTPDLEAIVLLIAVRFASNPENLRAETIGDYSVQRQVIDGFTLAEQIVLNRYRKRAR